MEHMLRNHLNRALFNALADFKRADDVLADFGTYYPGATNDDYEIAGFFWWQGIASAPRARPASPRRWRSTPC